ncbi:hypothetical protein ACIRL2_43655 [Embleya sp. NPDC127516]|uniref:hypothetical protein n=1 Tax=Embleya sp. NPDC127516 TaxID=3363990 RepID=UPI0038106149
MDTAVPSFTPYERKLLAMVADLTHTSAISILDIEENGVATGAGEPSEIFEEIAKGDGFDLGGSLGPRFARFLGLGVSWQTRDTVPLTGEFWTGHLLDSIDAGAPTNAPASATSDEVEVFSQLRLIEDQSRWAGNSFTAIRLFPGVTIPELWYFSIAHGLNKLDIDYCEYFDHLLVAKGVYGWQLLFAEVSLADPAHVHTRRRLTTMLHTLPRLFPDEDYSSLEARLRERL